MALGLSPVPPQRQSPYAIPDDVAVYRVMGNTYLDDELYTEGAVITWPDEPNQEMEPLNELARAAMAAFLKKLDFFGEKAAKKAGVAYISLANAHEVAHQLAKQEGKRVNILNAKKTVPLMGAKKNRRGSKVQLEETPLTSGVGGKHAIGRNAVNSKGAD